MTRHPHYSVTEYVNVIETPDEKCERPRMHREVSISLDWPRWEWVDACLTIASLRKGEIGDAWFRRGSHTEGHADEDSCGGLDTG